jgi:hypothetical protein
LDDYKRRLSPFSRLDLATIATACVAVWFFCKHQADRIKKQVRVETYLKSELLKANAHNESILRNHPNASNVLLKQGAISEIEELCADHPRIRPLITNDKKEIIFQYHDSQFL